MLFLDNNIVSKQGKDLLGCIVPNLGGKHTGPSQAGGAGIEDQHIVDVQLDGAGTSSGSDDPQVNLDPGIQGHQASG